MKMILLILLTILSYSSDVYAVGENNPVEIVLQQTDDDELKELIDKEG